MAGRLRKPPVMGGFFQRRENEVEIDNKINLGFSGGGFRATFYCLGAYRRLVELGLEKHVNEITSVSGGSIAAGAVISALAEGDFSSLLDFDRRVTTKLINLGQCNFRRRIMTKASWLAYLLPYLPKLQQLALAAALRPKMSKAFPQVLDEELFEGRKMKQAEAATEWSCNATCINTLKRFRFKSSDIYGYLLGRSSDIDDIPIAFAVAASAAYPVGFAPLELDVEAREFRDLYGTGTQKPENPAKLYLTDGGVYDNLGSESMLKSPVPLLMLDASGASQPLWDNSHMSKLELANRTLAVGLDQVVYLRRRLLFEVKQHQQLILGRGLGKIIEYWRERGTRGMNMEQLLQVEQLCAALRTDMDGFHDVEIEYLMWLGAVKIDYALRLLLPGNEQLQQSKMPKLPDYDAGFATAVLERGGKMSIFKPLHHDLHLN